MGGAFGVPTYKISASVYIYLSIWGGKSDGRSVSKRYIEYRLGLCPARVCVFLAQRDELFGEPLRFLGLVPGRLDGFVRDERGDEVAEEGLPVRGAAVQVPVFQGAAGHFWGGGEVKWIEWGGGSMDWCVVGGGRGWFFERMVYSKALAG